MEELITRPMEQAVSAVPGVTRVESTSSEGNSQVRLNFDWGTDLSEAADEVRTRVDRMRNRLPEDADPPTIFKFDSNAQPIMQLGVEGDFDPVTLRELAQNELAPRFERVDGVAAVTVNGGLRRQIHVELSKEKVTALNLSVNQVVQTLRTENQNTPLGEIYQGDSTFLVRSQGQFQSLEDIRNLVVMTREGVPVYLRDIADVKDTTEQRRSFMRINGKPGVQIQVQKQSGKNTVAVAQGVSDEVERVNREVPGIQMIVMQDNSRLHRARDQQRPGARAHRRRPGGADHLRVPARLPLDAHRLHVDPGVGDRHVRAALLRRLHAEHDDLRRPGARHRHDRRRGDRRAREHAPAPAHGQGPDDGRHRRQRGGVVGDPGLDADAHRRVHAAALPVGHRQHPVHAALGRGDVLAGDVALRRRHHRAGAVLALAAHARRGSASANGHHGSLYRVSERFLERMDEGYRKVIHVALEPPADRDRRRRGAGRGRRR